MNLQEFYLLTECQRMTDTMEYHPIGFHYWPWIQKATEDFVPEGPSECGICTNGARLIAYKFKGYVAGYHIDPSDSPDLVAYDCLGHDFAIVGDYLVDWWAWDYEDSIPSPVLHLRNDASLIREKYKPQSDWIIHPSNDYRATTSNLKLKLRNF